MPRLKSTHLDDLNNGDHVAVFTRDPEHRLVAGRWLGLYRSVSRREWYAVIDTGSVEFPAVMTRDIERVERRRKAAPKRELVEQPEYTQRDPAGDDRLCLAVVVAAIAFIGGMVFMVLAEQL